MPRVVASIEARMGSSRLPGKMIADVNGQPALARLFSRLRLCKQLDDLILATTTSSGDDVLAQLAADNGIACYRGSEDDVLNRVVEAQRQAKSEIVVEINGDCILLDPEVVDMGVRTFLGNECDVVSNCSKWAYPQGVGVQVFKLSALEYVEKTIADAAVREHVSLYFYQHPELYRIIHLYPLERWHMPELRLQLDYQQDLDFINAVYERLEPVYGDDFGLEQVMELLKSEPALMQINRECSKQVAM